jgi:hypothetical protein
LGGSLSQGKEKEKEKKQTKNLETAMPGHKTNSDRFLTYEALRQLGHHDFGKFFLKEKVKENPNHYSS